MLKSENDKQTELHKTACQVRNENATDLVYFRGLIEFSNICQNDCYYCGIRKSNAKVKRYKLTVEQILMCIDSCQKYGISSIVLQSGERADKKFTDQLFNIITNIKTKFPSIFITLSVGELPREIYKELFRLGVQRYLLRIETSDKQHYYKLHPESMSFTNRLRCLNDLKEIGYQVGTGVMINSPFQTTENLADDILFFKEIDIDMCGMGPFIPHSETRFANYCNNREQSLNLGLNMISALRITMPDINIAATTALETISDKGRKLGLMAGANVIMPQFSPFSTRKEYLLYNDKPVGTEDDIDLINSLKQVCKESGMIPDFANPGSSLHFQRRNYGEIH